MCDVDKKFISYAINLAKKNVGITAPNPTVGCVIVKDGEIVSTGVTARDGRPHAERVAMDKILNKDILREAVIYVTLEPCSHHGQTPPCVDLIIANKIKKVVIGSVDPNKKVNGNGIQKLREAGVEVVCGVLEEKAKELNKGFFKTQASGMPYVTLKLATSLDGKIATKDFDSKWITGEEARKFGHQLRSINEAIVVGANTLRKDDPALTCRISGLEAHSPRRIILSKNLDFDFGLQIFRTANAVPTLVVTGRMASNVELEKLGVEVILCKKIDEAGNIDLRDALKKMSEKGVNSILIEGGQNLATQAIARDLVDELFWIRSSKIIGGDGISAIGELGVRFVAGALAGLRLADVSEVEGDVVERYVRKVLE